MEIHRKRFAGNLLPFGYNGFMKLNKIWGLVAVGAVVGLGLPYKIDTVYYEISDEKINDELCLVILSDLHDDAPEKRLNELSKRVRDLKPDLILMPGDMAEERNHQDRTIALLKTLTGIPMYYTTGNHEEYRWDLTSLLARFQDVGVTVLDNRAMEVPVKNTLLEIGGIKCRRGAGEYSPEEVSDLFHTDGYRILLSHKPNWVELYEQIDADLFVSGHAHGGQWCIPFTKQGLAAPSQGLFPKYTSGIHETGKGKMLISRGLVRHYHGLPRLYNNPEIVVLTLKPRIREGEKES